jgi:hypothetical protein
MPESIPDEDISQWAEFIEELNFNMAKPESQAGLIDQTISEASQSGTPWFDLKSLKQAVKAEFNTQMDLDKELLKLFDSRFNQVMSPEIYGRIAAIDTPEISQDEMNPELVVKTALDLKVFDQETASSNSVTSQMRLAEKCLLELFNELVPEAKCRETSEILQEEVDKARKDQNYRMESGTSNTIQEKGELGKANQALEEQESSLELDTQYIQELANHARKRRAEWDDETSKKVRIQRALGARLSARLRAEKKRSSVSQRKMKRTREIEEFYPDAAEKLERAQGNQTGPLLNPQPLAGTQMVSAQRSASQLPPAAEILEKQKGRMEEEARGLHSHRGGNSPGRS